MFTWHQKGLGASNCQGKSCHGKRRWQGDGHLGKEVLKARGTIGRRKTEHIRKERAATRHSKGRPTLGVPKECVIGLERHRHTPLHHRAVFYLGLWVVWIYHWNFVPKLLNQNASAAKSVRPSAKWKCKAPCSKTKNFRIATVKH